jgi:type I restriction enzyme M protein
VITNEQAKDADYSLGPSKWVTQTEATDLRPLKEIMDELLGLSEESRIIEERLARTLTQL